MHYPIPKTFDRWIVLSTCSESVHGVLGSLETFGVCLPS